jgi:hypothetical protein
MLFEQCVGRMHVCMRMWHVAARKANSSKTWKEVRTPVVAWCLFSGASYQVFWMHLVMGCVPMNHPMNDCFRRYGFCSQHSLL